MSHLGGPVNAARTRVRGLGIGAQSLGISCGVSASQFPARVRNGFCVKCADLRKATYFDHHFYISLSYAANCSLADWHENAKTDA